MTFATPNYRALILVAAGVGMLAVGATATCTPPEAPPPRPKLDYDTPFIHQYVKYWRGQSVDVQLFHSPDGQPERFTGVVVANKEVDTPAGRVVFLTVRCDKGSRQFKLSEVKRLRFASSSYENSLHRAWQRAEGIDLIAMAQAEWDIATSLEEKPIPPPSSRLRLEETPKLNGHFAIGVVLLEARGERVEMQVTLAEGRTAVKAGTVVNLETPKERGKPIPELAVLNYFSRDGLQSVKIADIQRVKFSNPHAEGMFRPALDDIVAGTWSRLPKAPAPRPKS